MMGQGNYKFVQCALEHYCKMRLFAAPEFLRRMVSDGVQTNMPAGLIVQKLNLRAGTLAAVVTGSDMVTVSLPNLVSGMLGVNVSTTVKDNIKKIFGKAEAMGSDQILSELDKYMTSMPRFSQHDLNSVQAVVRLKDRMKDILGGTLPECPITMEEIKKEDIRILPCCTGILDKNSIEKCKGVCPLCRARIEMVGTVTDPTKKGSSSSEDADEVEADKTDKTDKPETPDDDSMPSNEGGESSKKAGKRPIEAAFSKAGKAGSPSLQSKRRATDKSKNGKDKSDSDFDDSSDDSDDDAPAVDRMPAQPEMEQQQMFEQKVSEISGRRPYSVDGIVEVLKAQVDMNASSRVLLCFGFCTTQRSLVRRITDRITAEIPNSTVTNIDSVARDYQKMEVAKMKFDDTARYPGPNIFVLNTTDKSSSVQGLDLHMTDLTIVADQCSLPSQRQAAGRSLRMKKRPDDMAVGERFPSKRLVVAVIQGFA